MPQLNGRTIFLPIINLTISSRRQSCFYQRELEQHPEFAFLETVYIYNGPVEEGGGGGKSV